MNSFIIFGEGYTYLLYLFLIILLKILDDCLYGINYNETFEEINLYKVISDNDISHKFIHITFQYFGTGLLGVFILIYEKCVIKPEKSKKNSKIKRMASNQQALIHKDPEQQLKAYELCWILILIHITWIIEEQLINIFRYILKDLDFWMFEILIITLITSYIFKIKIYKHQLLSISLNIFPTILKIVTIVLSFKNWENYQEGNLPILYKVKPFYLIGLIFYFVFILLRSIVNLGLKWLMDVKYIASNKLLMIHGFFGAFFCFIICLISTRFKCSTLSKDYDNNNDEAYLTKYLCLVKNSSNFNGTDYYFENLKLYFNNFDNKNEFFFIFLGVIINSFYKLLYISIIKLLTPIHIIFIFPLYYFIQKSILVIFTKIKKNYLFSDDNNIKKTKFFFDISGDAIAIIGFLIFLELIVLKCNGYDYNIKDNIIKRAAYETNHSNSDSGTSFSEDASISLSELDNLENKNNI